MNENFQQGPGVFILTICLFLAASCAVPPTKTSKDLEIRVGAILSITGMNAATGVEHRWGYQQAIADINSRGGVYVRNLTGKCP
jgi:ABC-type branched-subunit amino acid transport system substrate-binding protein